jgi:glutaredoxin
MRRRLCLVLLSLAAQDAVADTVVLRNGREYKGLVTEETDTTVCVSTESGEYVFTSSEVARVQRDGPLAVAGAEAKAQGGAGTAVEVVRMRGASRAAKAPREARVLELDEVDAPPKPQPPAAVRRTATAAPVSFDGPVTIYGTSWCGFCRLARQHLRARGVAFHDLDVEKDPEAAKALMALRRKHRLGGGVPVLDLGGRVVQGFDRGTIDAILEGR